MTKVVPVYFSGNMIPLYFIQMALALTGMMRPSPLFSATSNGVPSTVNDVLLLCLQDRLCTFHWLSDLERRLKRLTGGAAISNLFTFCTIIASKIIKLKSLSVK